MDPVSMGLAVAGSLVQGIGAAKAGKRNKQIANVNATNELIDGNAEAARIKDLARISSGRQIGAQAESGFEIGTGSAFDSLLESATQSELEGMHVMRQARSKAAAYRAQGASAAAEGKNAFIGSLFGAASTLAKGSGDYAAAKGG